MQDRVHGYPIVHRYWRTTTRSCKWGSNLIFKLTNTIRSELQVTNDARRSNSASENVLCLSLKISIPASRPSCEQRCIARELLSRQRMEYLRPLGTISPSHKCADRRFQR